MSLGLLVLVLICGGMKRCRPYAASFKMKIDIKEMVVNGNPLDCVPIPANYTTPSCLAAAYQK